MSHLQTLTRPYSVRLFSSNDPKIVDHTVMDIGSWDSPHIMRSGTIHKQVSSGIQRDGNKVRSSKKCRTADTTIILSMLWMYTGWYVCTLLYVPLCAAFAQHGTKRSQQSIVDRPVLCPAAFVGRAGARLIPSRTCLKCIEVCLD